MEGLASAFDLRGRVTDPGESDALIILVSRRTRKISVVRIVSMPTIMIAVIESGSSRAPRESSIAADISIPKPPSVRNVITAPRTIAGLVKLMGTTSVCVDRAVSRFAPHRLQYLSSIVYSVPQDGQYMMDEW